jgi:hypothetical protein
MPCNLSPIFHGMMYNGPVGGHSYRDVWSRCFMGIKLGTLPRSKIGNIMGRRKWYYRFVSHCHRFYWKNWEIILLWINDLSTRVETSDVLDKRQGLLTHKWLRSADYRSLFPSPVFAIAWERSKFIYGGRRFRISNQKLAVRIGFSGFPHSRKAEAVIIFQTTLPVTRTI